ncbi:hypothetical protein MLD38_023526 [Melastoma candidum]|uniref:Uncharacterized protein n=1 Tax=Melastoma candidum TaxID=119954 RepID=A0ACB9NPZ8_9MYRT|nr:hypothetical protein MLD38_023526 [Melastoma candidum]
MDTHCCKLCSRRFLNGRALGGHMKAHLSFLPPIPTTTTTTTTTTTIATHLSSTASYEDVPAIRSLRENPQKNIRFPDPNNESEAESSDRGGWKKRRSRRGPAKDGMESHEAEPVSCVSDTSPEEDVAICLMMLCRDDGQRNPVKMGGENGADSVPADTQKKVHQCEICKKCFRSSQALGGHRIIHRKKVAVAGKEKTVASGKRESFGRSNHECGYTDESRRIFECPFCGKVFGSGQALGGHKRSHLMGGPGPGPGPGPGRSWSPYAVSADDIDEKINNNNNSCIDLNLPAPTEDEDVCSVVSDDQGDGGGTPD